MKRGQSRLQSVVETVTSVAVGFVLALALQVALMRWHGLPADLIRDIEITIAFTVLSLCRSYFLRRLFNRLQSR